MGKNTGNETKVTEQKDERSNGKVRQLKTYEELEFTDDFMFCKILTSNKELCKELLEVILKKKISAIHYINGQQELKITYNGKGIRMDVYVEDDRETVYDLEMQVVVGDNLPRRSRFYQGVIDINLIEKGTDYKELKESFIIFICTADPFGEGLPVYTFEQRCEEMPKLRMGDGTKRVFLNASGNLDAISPELRAFLLFLKNHVATDEFTKKLKEKVQSAKAQKEWRVEYMTYSLLFHDAMRDARSEGREEGREEGLKNLIRLKIRKGKSILQIADELESTETEIRELYERVCKELEKDNFVE